MRLVLGWDPYSLLQLALRLSVILTPFRVLTVFFQPIKPPSPLNPGCPILGASLFLRLGWDTYSLLQLAP